MKKSIKHLAEHIAAISLVRVLFRLALIVGETASKGFGFFSIRAQVRLPRGSSCHRSVSFKYPENIRFEGPVMISPGCVFGALAPIVIGKEVRISKGVLVETASLDLNGERPYRHVARKIEIGEGVWLGANVIVLGGVTVGAGAVIGAGAVLSKSVPPGAIVVGAPTRMIQKKDSYIR